MNILYIKRAYNTRLHTQIHALYERGHSIVLLLDARIEAGYNGPAQWNLPEILSRFRVHYSMPTDSKMNSEKSDAKEQFRLINDVSSRYDFKEEECQTRSWTSTQYYFLRTLETVLSKENVDIIVSGNDAVEMGDLGTKLTIAALNKKIPIIYDCQDILSDCFTQNKLVKNIERFVNEEADGVVHTNPIALNWVKSTYRIKKGLAFPNYASRKCFAKKQNKLTETDGKVHLVYCGSVQQTPERYIFPFARDMKNMFSEIATLDVTLHLHLGLHPGSDLYNYYSKLESYQNVILHEYVPYNEMMRKLPQYDVGLIPLDLGSLRREVEHSGSDVLDDFFLSRADTSKQYEYTLAGLPVLTVPVKWISEWITANKFGTSFNSIDHLKNILAGGEVIEYKEYVKKNASTFTIENRIEVFEDFLRDVMNRRI